MEEITLGILISELKEMIPTLQYFNNSFVPYYEYNDMGKYEEWLAKTRRFLDSQFPNDKYVHEFDEISNKKIKPNQQRKLLAILEALANLPTIVPLANEKQTDKGVNIIANINNTNNQSQSQEQSVAINIFVEAIKDDLTRRQLKELKEVIKESGDDKEKARNGIIDKLKSFGSDVASNIVANIITNPMIWTSV